MKSSTREKWPRLLSSLLSAPKVTAEEVAAAAGVSTPTVRRWARFGLLPPPTVHYGLTPGRHSFWADHAPAQAKWVAQQLGAGRTFDQVRSALEAGEFKIEEPVGG